MNREQRRAVQRGQDPAAVEHQQLQKLAPPGTPQDVTSERATSQRHGKVTADKWNQ